MALKLHQDLLDDLRTQIDRLDSQHATLLAADRSNAALLAAMDAERRRLQCRVTELLSMADG